MVGSGRLAVVIGASGFLGGALARALADREIPIATFTRTSPFLDEAGTPHPALAEAKTIFWLASSIRPATAAVHGENAAADYRALTNLLEALPADGTEGGQRVVAVSSGGTVYDPSVSSHSETSPLAPANAYGEAMLQIEGLLRERAAHPVVLRVANAYGPGQRPIRGQGVIAHWLTAIRDGKPVHLLGSDEVARDYVFIDDVTDALIKVHEVAAVPPVVNIGSGQPTTLRDLLKLVTETVAPRVVDVRHDPGRDFDAPSTWLDVSLAASALGWKPQTELRTGLRKTWDAVKHGARHSR